jgi:ribonuclease Z
MRPLFYPILINGRFGDPALFVGALFERRAIQFDLGDITALPARNIRRIEHIFVSHAHIDHFIGFDLLLRVLVGRDATVKLYGPTGFIDRVGHKLQAYQWNLVDRFLYDLVFAVTEIDAAGSATTAQFRLKNAFAAEPLGARRLSEGVIHSEPMFRVTTAILEHRTPCLAFALEEAAHVNIWKNRLAERGLPVGSWLRDLKRAVVENQPDDFLIEVPQTQGAATRSMPLGALRDFLSVTRGQKIGYVTDAADTPGNRTAIIDLVRGADLLYIEAPFAEADAALAAERAHLTTRAAGEIARAAGVRRVEPFHFSPRYEGQEERMVAEVMAAFEGP